MPFVVRKGVVAVDDTDGIVQLEAILEAQAAARIESEHPTVLDERADACRDFDAGACSQLKANRGEEIIACGAGCGTGGQLYVLVGEHGLEALHGFGHHSECGAFKLCVLAGGGRQFLFLFHNFKR